LTVSQFASTASILSALAMSAPMNGVALGVQRVLAVATLERVGALVALERVGPPFPTRVSARSWPTRRFAASLP